MDIGLLFGGFIAWPWLALVPAAAMLAMYVRRRRTVVLVAALAWLAYFPYELAIKMRVLCSGDCNIRVDLLLFYPLLALLSVWAIRAFVKAR
jgi:hypothetical protein